MFKQLLWLMLGVVLVGGCTLSISTTGQSTDPQAAQSFLPNITGYNTSNADKLVDAITTVAGGSSLLSGNVILAGAVAKIDDMVQCYQNVGAVTARIYTQKTFDITNPTIPAAGVLAIINQERLRDNFLACALGAGPENAFSAQSAGFEPCVGSGDFKSGGQNFSYLYAATSPDLCRLFEQHFSSIRAQNP